MLCLAVFAVSIDATVLNVALPTISRELGAGTAELQWIVDAYTLALAGVLLTAGSLSDRFGRKKMLMAGLAVFGTASGLGALAQEPWQIIAARGLMGVGGAFFMPGTLSILVHVFSPAERAAAIGRWGALTALGMVLGPLLGGVLLEHFWWGAAFVLNVPVVVLALLGVGWIVPESSDPVARRADLPGTVLSTAAMGGILFGVISAPAHGWASGLVLGPLLGGLVVLALFFVRQATAEEPMLDLRLMLSRRFLGAGGTMAFLMFALIGGAFVVTQQLQLVLDFSPMTAGLATVPLAVATVISSPLSPAVAKAAGARVTIALGLATMAAGLGVLAFFAPNSGYPPTAVGLVLLGAGMGLAVAPVNDVLMSAGPPESSGRLSAMNDTVQELGSAFGVALIGSVLALAYGNALPGTAPPALRRSLGEAAEAVHGLPAARAGSLLDAAHRAFAHGMALSMAVCAATALLGAVIALVLIPGGRRPRPGDHPTSAGHQGQAAGAAPADPPPVEPPDPAPRSALSTGPARTADEP
ncbi:MFS transporter [Streptomyces sioyaensis]|uniref:MFS transporter n=1 Tax=Streptomyces sioyaensis TaxID=67364 RepID=UPI001F45840A|nr:MFS transporter [Streptomyces sioyaensis]MCF3176762.1 MFS transporter [Streptomyces sioyaensis]